MNSITTIIARYALGVAMLVFGANKFLHFMPAPKLPADGAAFMSALIDSGYIFPILGIVYIIIGLLLVINKAVPFALTMLVPISINILAFHLKFDMAGILFGAIISLLNAYLIYAYWDRFTSLFK